MSGLRETEVAAAIIDDGIDRQSVEAARAYPDLKILCLRCQESVLGSAFEPHLRAHQKKQVEASDIPSHWEAL